MPPECPSLFLDRSVFLLKNHFSLEFCDIKTFEYNVKRKFHRKMILAAQFGGWGFTGGGKCS
jgi:hypothetical protein